MLHAGTFSKLIFPAARIAWMVVPPEHAKQSHDCLRRLGGCFNSVAQATIAELLNNGAVARHLQRARGIYAQRREALVTALEASNFFLPIKDTGGSLSLVATLKKPVTDARLTEQFEQLDIGARSLESMLWSKTAPTHVTALVLGLGNVSTLKVPETVSRLTHALRQADAVRAEKRNSR